MGASYPHVRVEGGPLERGRQYGEQARERVRLSLAAYEQVFGHWAGWDWARVVEEARRYEAPIAAFGQRYVDEIRGIAEGAGVAFEDVLAINVRTEVMFAAKARAAAQQARAKPAQSRNAARRDAAVTGERPGGPRSRTPEAAAEARARSAHQDRSLTARPPAECSSYAVLPEASEPGGVLVGQNWDWLLHSFDVVVVIEAVQEDGPDFVTVAEAGLLAKTGLNSSGIGLVTNALVTDADVGEPGVPYHVLLRAILDAETITDALATLQRLPRSSSANYLVAHEDGLAVSVEATPGDYSRLFLVFPEQGVLLHTNHFLSPAFDGTDVSLWAMPDSPFRLERLRSLVHLAGPKLGTETFAAALADHAGYPSGVCCHPDLRQPALEQGGTVVTVLMELEQRRVWIADGPPCTADFRVLDYGAFLSKPSPVRPAQSLA